MKLKTLLIVTGMALILSNVSIAAKYKIDIQGMHASINFKISHLGTSWLIGRFDKFEGEFEYDAKNPNNSKITMKVVTSSVNTNHAERDSHIRAHGLLKTDKYPEATFVSESFNLDENGKGTVTGKFTLHGVEKNITVPIQKIGEGNDPWGGYRVGFEGTMSITLKDYGMNKYLGKSSTTLELNVVIEGVRQE